MEIEEKLSAGFSTTGASSQHKFGVVVKHSIPSLWIFIVCSRQFSSLNRWNVIFKPTLL